jgi:hypothetical protein
VRKIVHYVGMSIMVGNTLMIIIYLILRMINYYMTCVGQKNKTG